MSFVTVWFPTFTENLSLMYIIFPTPKDGISSLICTTCGLSREAVARHKLLWLHAALGVADIGPPQMELT